MTPRRHTLSVPNSWSESGSHLLGFDDWGEVDAQRVVVCVHGLTRNAQDFAPLAEALAATGRRVFSLNMAGRGTSARLADPMGYTYPSYAADCLAVMDNFHLRGVEWVGTSMGGIIGMMIAASNPGRIRSLVLNDIGIHISREAFERILTYVRSMPATFADRAEASAYLHSAFAPFGITDPAQWEAFVDASLLTDADGTLRYACDPAIIEPMRVATRDFTEIHNVNLTSVWEQIDIPTYILHGADSDILTVDTLRAMRAMAPRSDSTSIAGVGHAPALMSADQIALVVNWLTRPTHHLIAAGM